MHLEHEAELRIAVAEGLLVEEEVEALREEARRLEQSPLTLLAERRPLSDETLDSLRQAARALASPQAGAPDGASTLMRSPARAQSPLETPAFPIPGWDRYEGVRFLGQGGMGQVFLARDLRLRRPVALKFVRGDDAGLIQRLLSEARAQARVDHERVCQVYEAGEAQGRPFIAMQFVEGQPLHQLAGQLTLEQKVLVLREAAEGVHAAHRAGLIHRDLKPSNILVERTEDGRLKPFVMDFGLARDWREDGATATGSVLGTPQYMAPEQARGEVARLDRRADVYSLGATLYHLLTGQPPIPGANALEVLNHIATAEPRPPRALDPGIPADLEAIVLKCLEKDRSARYDSARALAEDLDRFLTGEPVRARPTGLGYRLRKKARKHWLVASVASTALLAVMLALGWAAYTRREASQRERLARQFTERVEQIEALARYSGLLRLHDVRADRQVLRARMGGLEAEIREAGELAVGPGHYALGRGALALGDETAAREHLEAAWQSGFREPRVAWALAIVMGHLYQDQLREAERLRNPALREARQQELQRRYRDPALSWLRQSEGAAVPSTEYVAALLAFYEERFDDALAHLDAMKEHIPWFHEAPLLRGDILQSRANRRWEQGDREGALADFEAGRRAYTSAAAIAESVPGIHLSLGKLEYAVLLMELYGQGGFLQPLTRSQEAVSRALQADPDSAEARLLEARLYRRLAEDRVNHGADAEEPLQKAIAAAREALRLSPEGPRARLELGRCFWLWGQHRQQHNQDPRAQLSQAVEHFESVRLEDRDYVYATYLGLIFASWAEYEKNVGVDPLPHLGKAVEAYLTATQLDERLPDAWINLGSSYFSRASQAGNQEIDADLERARIALEKARSLNPKHIATYFFTAQVHELAASRRRARGEDARPDLARALELYRQGLAINSQLPQLLNGAGLILIAQAREAWDRGGDPFPLLDEAQSTFEKAIAAAPEQGFAYHNISEALLPRAVYQRARGQLPGPSLRAAVEASQKALERIPGFSQPWTNLGRAYVLLAASELEQGRNPRHSLTQASEALQKSLERNASDAEAWQALGETRALQARWEEAERAFQRTLELAPERQEARVAFGQFYRQWASWQKERGQDPGLSLERGLEQVDTVLRARPDAPDALVLRAHLLVLRAESPSH
jgi:tetratricopeptide (TPR) repeat protein/predicted Ser/Thr protein kinase